MRKTFLYLFAILCVFSSCVNTMLDEPDELGMKDLVFNAKTYTQTPMSRAELSEACTKLSLVLYTKDNDGNYTLYKEVKQESTNSNFGTIAVKNVEYGEYFLVAIGHKGENHAVLENVKSITFGSTDNHITDTFYYADTLKVAAGTDLSHDIELTRCVAQFQMVIESAIPNAADKFKITIDGTAVAFDATKGLGVEAIQRIREINIPAANKGEKNSSMAVYLLLLEKEQSEGNSGVNIVVEALDEEGNVLEKVTHSNIPAKVGHQTKYTGAFFNNHAFSISVNSNAWDGTIERSY